MQPGSACPFIDIKALATFDIAVDRTHKALCCDDFHKEIGAVARPVSD